MSNESKAVFLSYASQDADAARRICEELRRAGVEVWFDQSELRGGDAWDAAIRRQIKECALFVPVISAHTQSRAEGYFRLEWRLAVERSNLMADDAPFLFPIVIGDVSNAAARVPDKFREVQWTRLRQGYGAQALDDANEIAERVARLLSSDVGAPLDAALGRRQATLLQDQAKARQKSGFEKWWWLIFPIMGVSVPIIGVLKRPAKPERSPPAAAQSEARSLADRAQQHYQGIFTREDLALAEELGRRATELEPTLARAWAVRAGAEACYLMRGFVAGENAQPRARNAQTFANRALALDRDEPEALIALGQLAMFQGSPSQAEAFYRRVLTLQPDNTFARRFLSIVLRTSGRVPEAIALMEDAVRRAPGDTLSHFDLAIAYAFGWDWARAWEEADASLAIKAFPGAQMLKVRLAFQWKGDVALMRELLEQVDVTYRGEDDAVLWDMRCGLFERRADRVLEAAGRTTRAYLEESFIFPGPKAWFTAQAFRLEGKEALARQQWQSAESVLRDRLQFDPQNLDLRLKLAVTLAWLKRKDEARQELAEIETAWREQLNPDRAWDLASYYAALGDASTAVPLLRMALNAGAGIAPLTVHHLKFDPWWDAIRDSAEFKELVSNPPPIPTPVVAASSA